MSLSPQHVCFADHLGCLKVDQVWEYEAATLRRSEDKDVVKQCCDALQAPLDFPSVSAALVPDDRVALAVDPNVPQVVEVVRGVIKTLAGTHAGAIDVVLWDEATDETLAALVDEAGTAAGVIRHQSDHRDALRYLAADEIAEPIYLNRHLVDADFVLPIVAHRPLDRVCSLDLTGVYPSLADSFTRRRHRLAMFADAGENESMKEALSSESQIAWLLGVHVMMTVAANADGDVGQILAGTPDAIRKQMTPLKRRPDNFPPAAGLVIAALDGDSQQQTWANAARGVAAASRYAETGGTIVLWSEINDRPQGDLAGFNQRDSFPSDDAVNEDGFPDWDKAACVTQTLARVSADHRLMLHCQLDDEVVESMGWGTVASADELSRLSSGFESCGILRAAQFAGSTIDSPFRMRTLS